MRRLIIPLLAFAMMLGGALAFAQDAPIRVGSKQFTESIVLGKIIELSLQNAGLQVQDKTPLGSTQVNREALLNGEIDVYPEYTGTAISNDFRTVSWAKIPTGASQNAYESYSVVSSLDAAINDLVWLRPAAANNTYALAVTKKFAQENNLKTVGDLAAYINNGGQVKMSVGDEFAQRPDGLAEFEKKYDFQVSPDQLIVIAGGTPAQTEQALSTGANGVNVAMAFATDGALKAYNFVVLDDPKGAQPIFQPTPVFRGEVIRAHPEIVGILNPIFATLDNETMQSLNADVDVGGQNPEAVAKDYLQKNGFIK